MRGRGEVRLTLNFWNCTGNPCFLRFQERARHKNLAGKCGLQTVEGEGAGMRGGGEVRLTLNFCNLTGNPGFLRFQARVRKKFWRENVFQG
jgi:hypothetical protein